MDRRFHTLGIAVTANERTDDFLFVFNSLKKGYRLMFKEEYRGLGRSICSTLRLPTFRLKENRLG